MVKIKDGKESNDKSQEIKIYESAIELFSSLIVLFFELLFF